MLSTSTRLIMHFLFFLFLASCGRVPPSSFSDNFDRNTLNTLTETGKMRDSAHHDWWLNSGAYIYLSGGTANTVQGRLQDNDRFRTLYAQSNAVDTDGGYRPQNLIRLVTRAKFRNFTQQVLFRIDQVNLSNSANRNQSNGVLFFHRYQDGDNLYYAGIRVDGYAVIKKKLNGKYYPLQTAQVYPGTYNRETNPNLLPVKRWLGLKTGISTNQNGNVQIAVYLKDEQRGPGWTKVLETEDAGAGADRITDAGYAGIRTDFMDVSFDDYEARENEN